MNGRGETRSYEWQQTGGEIGVVQVQGARRTGISPGDKVGDYMRGRRHMVVFSQDGRLLRVVLNATLPPRRENVLFSRTSAAKSATTQHQPTAALLRGLRPFPTTGMPAQKPHGAGSACMLTPILSNQTSMRGLLLPASRMDVRRSLHHRL